MPTVEVYSNTEGADTPLFIGEFTFLPRPGETISKDAGGYFDYYVVQNVWHREDGASLTFQACVDVKLSD